VGIKTAKIRYNKQRAAVWQTNDENECRNSRMAKPLRNQTAADYLCNMLRIDAYRNEVAALCQKHHVKELYLFGSAKTNAFNDDSDIDLLVQFNAMDSGSYFGNYSDFKSALEDLFHRPVDLVENQSIRNPVFRMVVDRESQLLYKI
jgi:predicted nucleotidyltransferase